jgi:hypothetical protein
MKGRLQEVQYSAVRKVGRNQPCPCGSGRKYKHCCGSPTRKLSNSKNQPEPGRVSAQIPLPAIPGEQVSLIVVPLFAAPDPRNLGGPKGLPGKYRVVFMLSRPGFSPVPEYEHSAAEFLKGDSHLAITKPAFIAPDPEARKIKVRANTEDGHFEFLGSPNEKGFLAKIESQPFDANDFEDAEQKAFRAVAPSLSNWSVHLDIPLNIQQIDTIELHTEARRMLVISPHLQVPFAVMPEPRLESEFRHYASLYREGLNTNSAVYRFLCFYKIIEGIQVRRARLANEARIAGENFKRPIERVPDNKTELIGWLHAIFPIKRDWDDLALDSILVPQALGKKFGQVTTTLLSPVRTEIAHALLKSGELTLRSDDLLHLRKVNAILPLTKCIVRRMLKNDFPGQFLAYLGEDGTIIQSA